MGEKQERERPEGRKTAVESMTQEQIFRACVEWCQRHRGLGDGRYESSLVADLSAPSESRFTLTVYRIDTEARHATE